MTLAYLAGRFDRGPEIHTLVPLFNSAGFNITSRWLKRSLEPSHAISDMSPAECAQEDIRDIDAAEYVFFFTEEPNQPIYHSGGRHVEFGYALAQNKRIIIIGPKENVFHHLDEVYLRLPDLDTLREFLEARAHLSSFYQNRGGDYANTITR